MQLWVVEKVRRWDIPYHLEEKEASSNFIDKKIKKSLIN
jgi:hypothetical protein